MFFAFRVFLVLLVIFSGVESASSRTSILSGSMSVMQEYDSNINLESENEEAAWFTVFSPSILFTSESEHDSFSFGYAPGLRLNQSNDENEVEHRLTAEGQKQFSSRLSGQINESYLRSNDYTYYILEYVQDEVAGIPLSEDRARTQFWTNRLSLSGEYEYDQDSVLGVGYANNILENESSRVDDYVKHHPYLTIGYRINQAWSTTLSYDYIHGDFDPTEDIDEHLFEIGADYRLTRHDLLSAIYQYIDFTYEGDRSDYKLHRGDVGWNRELGPNASLAAFVGLSYADQEQRESKTAFNYSVDYVRNIEKGVLKFGGKGGTDELAFNADADDGLSRFWSVKGSIDYQLLREITSQAYLSYRVDEFIELTPAIEEESIIGGIKLTYALWRSYAVSVGYSYRQLDSDRPLNDYEDHRAYLELSVGKELARWL